LSVVGRNGVVDVDQDSGFISGVNAGDSDKRSWSAFSATGDIYLRAAKVELGASESRCHVQGNLFKANKVLAGGKGLGDGEAIRKSVCGWEGDGRATVGDCRNLVNLEPDRTTSIPCRHVGASRGLRQVDIDDTGVVNRAVSRNANGRACGDRSGGCKESGEVAVVASEISAGHVGDRCVAVVVVSLPHIAPVCSSNTVDDESGEGIVR